MNPISAIAESPVLAIAGIPLVLGLAWMGVTLWHRRGRHSGSRVLEHLSRLGSDQLRDVLVPDGIGGAIHIDWLLLTPERILVLDLKRYEGFLFGGVHLETWTQLLAGKSYRFPNPVRENEQRSAALRVLVPDAAIAGAVLLAEPVQFPKGRPEGVYTIEELERELGPQDRPCAPELAAAWQVIRAIAQVERRRTAAAA